MGALRARNGQLVLDFRYRGHRCRESTGLGDTAANRRQLQVRLSRLEAEIRLGSFDYLATFPGSRLAARLAASGEIRHAGAVANLPTFSRFARLWQSELQGTWRASYAATIESILSAHLLRQLGELRLNRIDRAVLMRMRADLMRPDSSRSTALAPATVNRIMAVTRAVLQEPA